VGVLWLVLVAAGAYLLGSVSFAIIVTRLRTGRDIRTLGNRNPGTANVGRTLGRGWGALVLFLDMGKSLLPMLAARLLLFHGHDPLSLLAVYGVGLAAVTGHCKPVFYGFRGGGGIATALPLFFFFTPVEAAASMLLAGLTVLLFLRGFAFSIGRWLPMLFITLTPLAALAASLTVSVRLGGIARIGGHPWSVVAGLAASALLVWGMNLPLILTVLSDPRAPAARE
jgi:acyl-phosphate glycerol 3-phosphate acyltransferase